VTRDLGDLAASASRAAKAMPEAQIKGVRKSAIHTTGILRKEIAKVAGPDMRLSGASRSGRGAKVGAFFKDVYGKKNPTVYIRASGPIQLIERNTEPHRIRARGRTRKKRGSGFYRGRKALTVGTGLRVEVPHPGTTGQHPWYLGTRKAEKETGKIFKREVGSAIAKAW